MSSYTYAETFTRSHAQRLAGRVTADLRQSHLLYGSPSEGGLLDYKEELKELLVAACVDEYHFGFKRDGSTVWSLRYVVRPDGALAGAAGGVPIGVDVDNAKYFNFMKYSQRWFNITSSEKDSIRARLPFQRVSGQLPSSSHGYWSNDRSYAAGGVGLQRAVFRTWSR